jgi:hypothetical protein
MSCLPVTKFQAKLKDEFRATVCLAVSSAKNILALNIFAIAGRMVDGNDRSEVRDTKFNGTRICQ